MSKENKDNRLALKAGSWYVVSNFLIKSIAIITTPIFTRVLSPEQYGITNIYTSWLGIITIVGTLDIYSCVQIARHDFEEEEIEPFLSSILTVSSITLSVLYLIIRSLNTAGLEIIELPNSLIDIMFIEVLFGNAFTILQTKNKAYLKYRQFVLFTVIISVLSPIFSISLINLLNENLHYGRIVGNALPKIAISIFIFIHIIRKGKTFINVKYWKYALWISVPLIPHHLAGNILNHFDKIMISKYDDFASTGLYSLAYSYASILSVAWNSFNQAWVPWFYSKMKEDNISEIKNYVKPYVIVFSLIFMGMLVVAPEAIKFFGPEIYWDGIWVVPPVLLGIFMQFVYSLYVNVQFYMKKTKYISLGTMLAAFVNIILNYIFIPKFGYLAAAYTTLVGYCVLFLLHYKISSIWEPRDIYNKKFLFQWILFIVFLTICIVFLFNYLILRYIIFIIGIFLVIFKYKNKILVLLKEIRRK